MKTAPQQKNKNSFNTLLKPFNNYSLVPQLKELKTSDAVVYYIGSKDSKNKTKNIEAIVETHALDFQLNELKKSDKKNIHFIGRNGPVWILLESVSEATHHEGLLEESSYTFARESFGAVATQAKGLKLKNLTVYFQNANSEAQKGAVIGLELSSYNFLTLMKGASAETNSLSVQMNMKKETLDSALQQVTAVQVARHLVNLPPNLINPATVEKLAFELPFSKATQITVWDEKKCESEGMNLLLAVGAGASVAPRMIRFKYRPAQSSKNKKPIAFVGKGITFDTGGLDIKPSSAMRLMKKDMGGAAAVMALALWADQSGFDRPCDFYLALAENSVDGFSMRPSDVYKSRAGYLVEIDNTDAEGRLVLADVMDVAITQKGADEPEILVDIATLTGAIKVALGADVAGLFTNDDRLAQQMMSAGQRVGELNWRMPLIPKYFSGLNSQFADFKNSADGFGGAITAALFLQKYAGTKKWAHLDVYAWNDKPTGALAAGAASGQPVQSMIEWLESL